MEQPLGLTINRMFAVALLLLLHAFLQNEKGPDDETTALQRSNKLVFQRTVNHVVAHRPVNDVMTLVTYSIRPPTSPFYSHQSVENFSGIFQWFCQYG